MTAYTVGMDTPRPQRGSGFAAAAAGGPAGGRRQHLSGASCRTSRRERRGGPGRRSWPASPGRAVQVADPGERRWSRRSSRPAGRRTPRCAAPGAGSGCTRRARGSRRSGSGRPRASASCAPGHALLGAQQGDPVVDGVAGRGRRPRSLDPLQGGAPWPAWTCEPDWRRAIRRSTRGVTSRPTTAQALSTSTVCRCARSRPPRAAAAASGRNADRMPRPIQYIGKTCATTCTQPHSAWIG